MLSLINMIICGHILPFSFLGLGPIAQLVTYLATDASLTADPGVVSLIPARSHTFVETDHEIISTDILLPSAESLNCLFKLAQEKVWSGELTIPP